MQTTTQQFINQLHQGGSYGYWWTLEGHQSFWWETGKPTPLPGGKRNVYVGVHPTVTIPETDRHGKPVPSRNVRSQIDSIAACSCLFAEYDAKDFDGQKLRALDHIQGMEPRPSVVVDSGGGYHCYWLLRAVIPLDTPEQREAMRRYQAAWVVLMGGDTAAKDLARVLRVPGTMNYKYDPPRPVQFVWCELDHTYDPDYLFDLAEHFVESSLPATKANGTLSSDQAAQQRASTWLGNAVARVRSAPDGQKHATLLAQAVALGGLVPLHLLSESEIESTLYAAIEGRAEDGKSAQDTIRDGIAYGKAKPWPLDEVLKGINRAPVDTPVAHAASSAHDTPDVPVPDQRPVIDRTTVDLPALVQQAWDATHAANDPPIVFRRANELVRLERSETETLLVKTVDDRRMMGILARAARWVRITRTKEGVTTTDTIPPTAVVNDCLVNPDMRMPALTRVVYAPLLADGDVLLTEPGYHPAAKVYYDPKAGTVVPRVSAQPTEAEMIQARTLVLDELLADFPFVSNADRAHAVALFLLPFVRDLIDGPTPLHLIEAPTMGSGKGLLAETLLMPALGEPPSAMTEATTDEEWGKLITSNLLAAPTVIYIDNLNRTLASGKLAAALTAREFSDRVLGKSEQVNLPVRCVWAATANNPLLSTEIARRCIRIRIDPRTDEPWKRATFKHSNLRSWVELNRGQLIWAALTMACYGLAHGTTGRALGSYEAWSAVLGRILSGCGLPDFLGNLDLLYARADAEGSAWRALIDAWWQKYQDQAQPAGEIFTLITDTGADDLVNGKDEVGRKKSFGKALARVVDRVFSVDIEGATRRLQIAEGGVRHKAKLWRLVPMDMGVLGVLGVCSSPRTRDDIDIDRFPMSVRTNPPNPHNPPDEAPTDSFWSGVPQGRVVFLKLYLRGNKESDQNRARELCEEFGLDYEQAKEHARVA